MSKIENITNLSSSLSQNYLAIANALMTYEKLTSFYPYRMNRCRIFFQTEVAFISTEVLESYLDDLLDPEVKDNSLFISFSLRNYLMSALVIGGLFTSLLIAIYAASSGSSSVFAFILSCLTATPFMMIWYFFPIDRLSRRMRFAKLISQEVSRRRGDSNMIPERSSWLGMVKSPRLNIPAMPRITEQ